MRYLVDTNAWIGFLDGDKCFGRRARECMADEPWECCLSLAGVWEASIKVGLGKLKLPYSLEDDLPRIIEENGFTVIAPEWPDVTAVQRLEPLHDDPFDRIQVVQARRHRLDIISRDPVFDRYGLQRVW